MSPEHEAGPVPDGVTEPDVAGGHDNEQSIVSPAAIEQYANDETMAELFALLDPFRDLLELVNEGPLDDWYFCPACRRHGGIAIHDCANASCARCGKQWTRYALRERVLATSRAVRRIVRRLGGAP